MANISAWDLRSGKTAGGVTGSLSFCHNGARTTTWDYQTAPAVPGLDVYDTFDDYANNGAFPSENALALGSVCSSQQWEDVSLDSNGEATSCAQSSHSCMMRDRGTKLTWSERVGSTSCGPRPSAPVIAQRWGAFPIGGCQRKKN